ncbi:hypothetical protein ABIC09_003179 [Bradyrhizobium sp. S3.12.5]
MVGGVGSESAYSGEIKRSCKSCGVYAVNALAGVPIRPSESA